MKKSLWLVGLIAVVLAASAACAPAPELRNERFLQDDALVAPNEDCAPPCWRGITPGETTWTEAVANLEDQTDIDDPQIQDIPNAAPARGAVWQQTNGDPCCQIVSEDGETISSIFLQLAPTATLSQVIDTFGEPTYVIGTPGTDDQAIVNLFFPEQSMIVFAFAAGAANGELNASSEVIGVYYTTPDRMDLGIRLSDLYGWKGFGPFSQYAPDAADADFAITQSVTLTPTPTATASP